MSNSMEFGDHHEYSAEDLARLRGMGEVLITTAKNTVKVEGVWVVEQRMKVGGDILPKTIWGD